MAYIGLTLTPESRASILDIFPGVFAEVIAHHITYRYPVDPETAVLPEITSAKVIGYASDLAGLEALVVEVDGSTKREDGEIYHITLSLNREAGFKPADSKHVINEAWYRIANPITIDVVPEILN